MAGLYLHTSNRLEILADSLAELISQPLASPFDREIIVVQSRGMERWLRMQLALRHGISANLDFPFPNTFLRTAYCQMVRDLPFDEAYDVDAMVWRVMDILPQCINEPEFSGIRDYLGHGSSDESLYQLSKYISACFDQYLVFRPDMVLGWEEGRGSHWQAVLWRKLTKREKPIHKARAKRILLRVLDASKPSEIFLPKRISIFGISSLPPYHLDILAGFSKFIDVHFFVMNPCREYWFDIVSEWRIDRIVRDRGADPQLRQRLHLETGNALLASMGLLGRDFISAVMDLDPIEEQRFVDPGSETMLTAVQSDILGLKESSSHSAGPISIKQGDRSISVHSCHSALREMEILYDNLLYIFEKEPHIGPKDVVVMAPDIKQYAPYIDAVFGKEASDPKAVPYSIADRGYMISGELAPALFHLFDLIQSRFTVSSVLSFLEREPVKRRFGFTDTDIATIRRWVTETRVHWGIDENMKQDLQLPPIRENTWEAGLERLLLGYGLPGQGKKLFRGILPYDHVEGEAALLLGNLISLVRKLAQAARLFSFPAQLQVWQERITTMIDELFCPSEATVSEMQSLLEVVARLGSAGQKARFQGEVSLRVVRAFLEARIDEAGLTGGFLSKGITFCSILPMRSIPFKVVCLVGMNHDTYPRRSRGLGFDLMAASPRKGDRSRRNDDRYLFLEAILSARDYLIITYVGQSEADNSIVPPSPLVSELLDYLERNFVCEGGEVRARVLKRHRLRPFNPIYFEPNSDFFTYLDTNLEPARLCLKPKRSQGGFFKEQLPACIDEAKEITVEDLERFLTNPARFILQKRLGIRLRSDRPLPPDQEPAVLCGLEAYNVDQRLVKARLLDTPHEELYPILRAEGLFPHGSVGTVEFERRSLDTDEFSHMVAQITQGAKPKWVQMEININGYRIHGRLGEIYGGTLVHYRFAQLKAQDYLRVWLHHLLINAMDERTAARQSYVCGRDGQWMYKAVKRPQEHVSVLIDIYLQGLKRPLRFFPQSSFAYAVKLLEKGAPEEEALESARRTWQGSRYNRGEREDEYLKLCFGEQDPLDTEFKELSTRVFSPLLAHREKI